MSGTERKGVKINSTELILIMKIRLENLMDAGDGTRLESEAMESIDSLWQEIQSVYKAKREDR